MKIDPQARTVELSRTNLLSLLAKLDGHPPNSYCTIEKDGWLVKAVEDTEHYATRPRGSMVDETEMRVRLHNRHEAEHALYRRLAT